MREMPSVETGDLTQKAVLWALSSYDEHGEPTVKAAIEIDVRWEEAQSQSIDPDGNTVAISAVVMVDRDIEPNSEMWQGELEKYNDLAAAPTRYRVVGFEKAPDVKGRSHFRRVLLTRIGKRTPNLA